MCFYDVIVALMNIHEIKCQISKQVISETSDDNLARFSAINNFHQCLFHIHKAKPLAMTFNIVSIQFDLSNFYILQELRGG